MSKAARVASVTGIRLMEIQGAFKALEQRALPPVSDMRVASIFTPLREILDHYSRLVRAQEKELAEAEGMEDGSEERRERERRALEELTKLGEATYEVPVPARRLTEADLPVAVKTKDGNGLLNSAGRAAMARMLSPEFFELKSPDHADEPPQSDPLED